MKFILKDTSGKYAEREKRLKNVLVKVFIMLCAVVLCVSAPFATAKVVKPPPLTDTSIETIKQSYELCVKIENGTLTQADIDAVTVDFQAEELFPLLELPLSEETPPLYGEIPDTSELSEETIYEKVCEYGLKRMETDNALKGAGREECTEKLLNVKIAYENSDIERGIFAFYDNDRNIIVVTKEGLKSENLMHIIYHETEHLLQQHSDYPPFSYDRSLTWVFEGLAEIRSAEFTGTEPVFYPGHREFLELFGDFYDSKLYLQVETILQYKMHLEFWSECMEKYNTSMTMYIKNETQKAYLYFLKENPTKENSAKVRKLLRRDYILT